MAIPKRQRQLGQPLLEESGSEAHRGVPSWVGLVLVTVAALLFGVVAAFVKAITLPTLVLQLARSLIEWLMAICVILATWWKDRRYRKVPCQPESELLPAFELDRANEESWGEGAAELVVLFFGPSRLRGWLVLRAALYWAFTTMTTVGPGCPALVAVC